MTTHLPVLHQSCGSCTACCEALQVKALGKGDYERCKHLRRGPIKGCGIYSARPNDCGGYECLWLAGILTMPELRPDRCGFVLSGSESEKIGPYIMVHELRPGAIKTELAQKILRALAETVVIIEITRDGMRKLHGGPAKAVREIVEIVQENMDQGIPGYLLEELEE